MSTSYQWSRRKGTTAQHSTFVGINGELTVDTDKKTVVVHDGVKAGGYPLAKEETLSQFVKLTGDQTITGVKTFSSPIEGNLNGNAKTVTNGVYTTGDQTIDGVKTFSSSPIVPTPTTDTQAANKAYVDSSFVANDTRVKTALNATGNAPIYACRAWVNFDGTRTVAIRASGNVSSITDIGVGRYTVNFTTAMPDANYSAGGYIRYNTTSSTGGYIRYANGAAATTVSSNSIHVVNGANGEAPFDAELVSVSYFR